MKEKKLCIYQVDSTDTILTTGGNWDHFAAENDQPMLKSEVVVGRTLWEFISDSTTKCAVGAKG
jgi:hypothetical protein